MVWGDALRGIGAGEGSGRRRRGPAEPVPTGPWSLPLPCRDPGAKGDPSSLLSNKTGCETAALRQPPKQQRAPARGETPHPKHGKGLKPLSSLLEIQAAFSFTAGFYCLGGCVHEQSRRHCPWGRGQAPLPGRVVLRGGTGSLPQERTPQGVRRRHQYIFFS